MESHLLAWNTYPIVWLLTAIGIVWLTRRTVSGISGSLARILILVGLAMNATVTLANGGVMPVVGMPLTFRPASAEWIPATTKHHLLFLADHYSLWRYSVGDIVLRTGAVILFAFWIYRKLSPQSKEKLNVT